MKKNGHPQHYFLWTTKGPIASPGITTGSTLSDFCEAKRRLGKTVMAAEVWPEEYFMLPPTKFKYAASKSVEIKTCGVNAVAVIVADHDDPCPYVDRLCERKAPQKNS